MMAAALNEGSQSHHENLILPMNLTRANKPLVKRKLTPKAEIVASTIKMPYKNSFIDCSLPA